MVKGKKAALTSAMQLATEKQKQLERDLEEARLKELENSSSSTTETETTESFRSLEEVTPEEEPKDIFEILYDTDTESLEEEELDYGEPKPQLEETDFFEGFREMPNVDAISVDISVASIVIEKPVQETDTSKDMGKFVNPLTGLDMKASAHSVSSSSDEQKEVEETEEEGDDGSFKEREISEESVLLVPKDALDLDVDVSKPVQMEDTLETFLEFEIQTEVLKEEEIDWVTVAREEEALRLQQNTENFLNDLICKAVVMAEYISPERILKQNLDKQKLLLELADKYPNYLIEKSCCEFLNRQMVQHFRRKKSFRSIMEDNPKTLQQDKQKLFLAKKHLDEILGKEAKLESSSKRMQKELQEQYEQFEDEIEEMIQSFESKVRKYLARESWPKLNGIIEQLLLKMRKYRKEVSEVRFTLFLQQHTQARLTQLLNKIEDLGNGLNMKDFGHLQAETQTLDKKIEERNAELNKLHLRCHNDIHTLAHYREKQQMLCTNITIQSSVLYALIENKRALREHLYALKLQHNRMHAQLKKLSAQGGLLDKPALMFDYDRTVERCREQREIVNYLRRSMNLTQKKIDDVVKNCSIAKIN